MQINKLLIFLLAIFLVCIFTIHVHADRAIVTEDKVNIRSGPGTEYDPIGQANLNDEYKLIRKQNNWLEIEFENGTGWIIDDYILVQKIQENNKEGKNNKAVGKTITIQHDRTQLRNGPSTDYEMITFANAGEEYEVISETAQWYELSNDKITSGYVYKELITKPLDQLIGNFENKTIVIDAGHGGHDVGAIGATGTYEKDFTYLTALELEKELTSLGANVILTRPDDVFISLKSRASYSNLLDTDAYISIHYNSFPEQPDVTGIESYYYHEQDKELANFIQQEIVKETNARDRGTSFGDFYVIRQNFKPAVLIELGFISNDEKEKLLQTTFYQKQIVTGIVSGLGKYFLEN
ncbi:N-acetylmuramoyl-L-alanine amidase [Oceanobacillus halophilus]|uniref:N-acetylmuramoyl-L-alanine amidase n=1 Tax=Oceanobacillus halophilus TaxID=930130 RepID=UPI001314AF5D|nr:N-acetylmuramoyl-L-alanine amidase [Oceanobacillus halophilus]